MKFQDGFTDEVLARAISIEAYDLECEALNCPTPKAKRKTKLGCAVQKHPKRNEYRLVAEHDRIIQYIREPYRDNWKSVTDSTEDEWQPIIRHKTDGTPVPLKKTLNEPERLVSKVNNGTEWDQAIDELISERP